MNHTIYILTFWVGILNLVFPNTNTLDSGSLSSKATYKLNLADSLPDLYFSSNSWDTFCLHVFHNNPNIPYEYYTIECCNQGGSIESQLDVSIYIFDELPSAGVPLVMDSSVLSAEEWLSGECLEFEFLRPSIDHPRYQYSYQHDHTYYYVLNIGRNTGAWRFPENDILESDYSNNMDSFYLRPRPNPVVLPMDTSICEGDSMRIELGSEYRKFLWSDSTTNHFTIVQDEGTYWVEVRTTNCYKLLRDSLEVSLLTVDYDEPLFEVDCERNAIEAELKTNDGLNFLWSNGSEESLTYFYHSDSAWLEVDDGVCRKLEHYALPLLPNFNNFPRFQNDTVDTGVPVEYYLDLDPLLWEVKWMPEDRVNCDTCPRTMINPSSREEDIQVILTHASGCQYEYSFGLYWDKTGDLWMPNAFSPNGDGHNDVWRIYQKDEDILFLKGAIYNRWGDKIKFWNEVDQISWDGMFNGKVLDSGVYLYWLQYTYTDGEIRTIYGDINLFR